VLSYPVGDGRNHLLKNKRRQEHWVRVRYNTEWKKGNKQGKRQGTIEARDIYIYMEIKQRSKPADRPSQHESSGLAGGLRL
jgi:hypothetical protein